MRNLLIPALLLAIAAPAMAMDHGSFYISGEGGVTSLDTSTNIDENNHSVGNFGYAFKGGYQFPLNPQLSLGIEAGYLDLGKSTFGADPLELEFKQHAGDLLAVATYGFNNGVDLFAKAGAAYVTQKVLLNDYELTSSHWLKPEIAGGVGYKINQHLEVTGTVSHIFASQINNQTTDPDTIASSTSALLGLKVNL